MSRKTPISFKLWKYVEKHSTARSELKNKASYNTDYIVPDLIDFFGIEWKEIKTQIEKKVFIIVKNIVLTKNWFVVSNFLEFPKHPYGKIMFWPSVFATKNQG